MSETVAESVTPTEYPRSKGQSDIEELAFMRLKPGRYRMLTLRQPYAWLVVFGGKDVENRSWTTDYRGPILIHAGKEMTRAEYRRAHEFALRHDIEVPGAEALDFGGIVGIANLVDIVSPSAIDPKTQARRRWHMAPEEVPSGKPQFGWLLQDITPVEFIPCQGAQGLRWFNYEQAA